MRPSIAVLLLLGSTSAQAETPTTLRATVGLDVGGHEHSNDQGGSTVGADFDLELRRGVFLVGATAGYLAYGEPLSAKTYAVRAGIDKSLDKSVNQSTGRKTEFHALLALEVGVHDYSPNSRTSEFLGPVVTTTGEDIATTFVGARAGLATTIHPQGWGNGVIFKLELIGRRDLDRANLYYRETSCGGLFNFGDECSASDGMKVAGGTEVGVRFSFGVAFGG
jgi:hypothetical protein